MTNGDLQRKSENPGQEGPALVHPIGVKYTELRLEEVMPVFERPYLKENSTGHRSEPIFGVYDDESLGVCFEFFKPQILGRRLLSQ
jgi:hypothetical protein